MNGRWAGPVHLCWLLCLATVSPCENQEGTEGSEQEGLAWQAAHWCKDMDSGRLLGEWGLWQVSCFLAHACDQLTLTPLSSFPQAALSDTESGVQLSSSERTADTSDGSLRGLSGQRTPTPPRHSSPGRGRSPRRGLSPACSDSSTLTLIHSALHKRQLQVQVARDPGAGPGPGAGP